MLEVEEVETNGQQSKPEDFPTLEQLDEMRNKRLAENLKNCQKELAAIMEKYKVRFSCRVSIIDGNIEENNVIIVPR